MGLGLVACVISCMAGNFAGSYWNFFTTVGYMYVLAALVMRVMINIVQDESNDEHVPVHDMVDETIY